jgi:dTDP-4-dehydrorhamnose 3,5-epimerase
VNITSVDANHPHVKLLQSKALPDERGYFFESLRFDGLVHHPDLPAWSGAVQENVSVSKIGVFRGLHLQNPNPQSKIVRVLRGAIMDVFIDMRGWSPTFLKWGHHSLSAPWEALFIPAGYAHGFLSVDSDTLVHYHNDAPYCADSARSIQPPDDMMQSLLHWAWDVGVQKITQSAKDREAVPCVREDLTEVGCVFYHPASSEN